MLRYLPIQGTDSWSWGVKGEWWQAGSPFTQFMTSEGFEILNPDRPFLWSTDLNGHKGWLRWFRKQNTDHKDWQAGGASLLYYLDGGAKDCGIPYVDRNVIAHSHGLQVVLYACSMGLRVRRLISVGSPIRHDMSTLMAQASKQIGFWLHLHDTSDDGIQIAGEFGDGRIGRARVCPFAHMNIGFEEVGHSKLLRDPSRFHLWQERHLLDHFRQPLSQLKGSGNSDE